MNKEVNEKKKKYAIVITFLVLMICIIGGTYAYFALTASNNSVTGSVGGASLNLSVTKVYPTSEHNSKNMIPQLESTLDEAISLEHKCVDDNGNVICQVYSATVTNVGSTTSVLNGMISFTGIENMPNLKWMRINDSNTLGTYSSFLASTDKALFEENKSFGANTSNTYYFVFWIDETGDVQTDIGDFRATIEFDSADGGLTSTVRPSQSTFASYISSLYDDSRANSVYIADDSSKQQVHLDSESGIMKVDQGSTYGVEYRYYGASPNNYVEYNNELWRIISVSKVFSSESDTIGETRVRIIKEDSIGKYAWDDISEDLDNEIWNSENWNYSNDWTDATLMCQLNTMYYNDTIQACSTKVLTSLDTSLNQEAKSLIDNTLWYLGAGSGLDLYADDYYSMERINSGYGSNPTRWTGKVGIMYPSDYLYAADLSVCKANEYDYYVNCYDVDWLYGNEVYVWFLNSDPLSSKNAWCVDHSCRDGDGKLGALYNKFAIYPLVVLKSNVVKAGGSGTDGDPYKIELSN